jgi:hypothetical protein
MEFKEHMNLCNKQVRFVSSSEWWCKVQSATIERLESNDKKTWIKCLDTCFLSLNLICCVYNSALGIGAFLLLTDGGDTFSVNCRWPRFYSVTHGQLRSCLFAFKVGNVSYCILNHRPGFFVLSSPQCLGHGQDLNSASANLPPRSHELWPEHHPMPPNQSCKCQDTENSLWLVESLINCEPLWQARGAVRFVNFLRQNGARGTSYAGLAQENSFGSA